MKVIKKIEDWLYAYAPYVIGVLSIGMIIMLALTGVVWSTQLFLKVIGVM